MNHAQLLLITSLLMCLSMPAVAQALPTPPGKVVLASTPTPIARLTALAAPAAEWNAEVAPEHEYPEHDRQPTAGKCALGHLCLGPVFTLGMPNLVGIGAHSRIGRVLGVGVDYQYLPTFGIESIPVNASAITLEGRLYPTGDSFFFGAGVVYQSVEAEGRLLANHPVDGQPVTLAGKGELGLTLLKLGVGWLGAAGPVIGIDLAIEIPLASRKLDIRITGSDGSEAFADETAALRRKVQNQADNVLDIIPLVIQLNFLRLGYIF